MKTQKKVVHSLTALALVVSLSIAAGCSGTGKKYYVSGNPSIPSSPVLPNDLNVNSGTSGSTASTDGAAGVDGNNVSTGGSLAGNTGTTSSAGRVGSAVNPVTGL